MAYSVSSIYKTAWGNKRVVALSITADAASGAFATGLSVVDSVSVAIISAATAAFQLKLNQASAGTATNGDLFVKAAASGDVFQITAVGK